MTINGCVFLYCPVLYTRIMYHSFVKRKIWTSLQGYAPSFCIEDASCVGTRGRGGGRWGAWCLSSSCGKCPAPHQGQAPGPPLPPRRLPSVSPPALRTFSLPFAKNWGAPSIQRITHLYNYSLPGSLFCCPPAKSDNIRRISSSGVALPCCRASWVTFVDSFAAVAADTSCLFSGSAIT